MIEPLRIAFDVRCTPRHAFDVWTARATQWWPPEHTMSGRPGMAVTFEPRVGGRIFEVAASGEEMEWGEVTLWDPPRRLAYLWHIATDRTDATDVEIAFSALPDGRTRIEIEHRGWERLGARGQPWRDANRAGWDGTLPAYIAACEAAA